MRVTGVNTVNEKNWAMNYLVEYHSIAFGHLCDLHLCQ
jgi:hypothetical protein